MLEYSKNTIRKLLFTQYCRSGFRFTKCHLLELHLHSFAYDVLNVFTVYFDIL